MGTWDLGQSQRRTVPVPGHNDWFREGCETRTIAGTLKEHEVSWLAKCKSATASGGYLEKISTRETRREGKEAEMGYNVNHYIQPSLNSGSTIEFYIVQLLFKLDLSPAPEDFL